VKPGRALSAIALGTGLGLAAAVAFPAAAEVPGDAERGGAAFTAKHCARCHAPRAAKGVGPALERLRRPQGAFELAGRLWNHAPAMFTTLRHEGLDWPSITAGEMADLMAYLQADPALDPEPDLFKGQVAVLRKGCLKCHSLRREGGRLAPDLAERYPAYDSAVAWATSMWAHSPRMAVKALEVGVRYPRFAGNEMRDLVGFLKSAGKNP
jgi:mono/diheme cytochrome c family protein